MYTHTYARARLALQAQLPQRGAQPLFNIYIYIYIHIHTYVFVYIYICIYVYIHIFLIVQ